MRNRHRKRSKKYLYKLHAVTTPVSDVKNDLCQ
jgi:hypothetical protein